jgi:hypothetical protein
MFFYLIYPVRYILETFIWCTIICQYDTLCTSIICLCYCSESFLTSCIPYLHLHIFTIQVYGSDFEINTYSQ